MLVCCVCKWTSKTSPCCCGISLKTGAKILAILLLLRDLFGTSYYATTAATDLEKAWEEDGYDLGGGDDSNDSNSTETESLLYWIAFYGFVFVFGIVDCIMAVVLFLGASHGRISACTAWLRYGLAVILICAGLLVDTLIRSMDDGRLVTGGIGLVLYGYTLLVVGALKEELHREKETAAQFLHQYDYLDGSAANNYNANVVGPRLGLGPQPQPFASEGISTIRPMVVNYPYPISARVESV